MIQAGIEALNLFAGVACLDVTKLAAHRGLDNARFGNLLMKQKSVALPYEDPVSFAVNAARPIVDALTPDDRARIELLITCTESGVDFGKSLSTYVHQHLGLSRHCRLFEIKQACYSGTAGLHAAVNFVLSNVSPGAKALVVTTDISRFMVAEGGDALTQDWSFAEPSGGAGAVAMLISDRPAIFQIDAGASGVYGYEVMDTCRPQPDTEAGNADLSLMSYLDCCEQAYGDYKERVVDVDYASSFDYLVFHTPFGGMVKGAHRTMMRKFARTTPAAIDADFERRVAPGLSYCQRVGNIMGGSIFMALAGVIDHGNLSGPRRIGAFSYGSGCCSEFYSGVVGAQAASQLAKLAIRKHLDARYELSIEEYEATLRANYAVRFGIRNVEIDRAAFPAPRSRERHLVLQRIREFHREYAWTE